MKIIHVVECFAGGVLNFVIDLTTELKNEEHIIVYGTNREDTPVNFSKLFPNNVKFIKWTKAQREMKPLQDLRALIELYNILKNIKDIDVIHLHSSKAGFLGRIAAYALGKSSKTIYTTHAISFLRLDVSPKKRKLFIYMEKFASLFGGKIVACSKSEKEAIEAQHIKNVTYINNGIRPLKIEKKPNTTDKITIISVGRLSIQKNPRLFNEIAKEFITNKDVQFIWCGDGELKSELTSPNIKCTGWITKDEIAQYLASADIYLSTSLWEGLPLSVLEAMSIGLPLVLSDCVGNRDLIQGNGFLYKNKLGSINCIIFFLNNKQILHEKGNLSRKILGNDLTVQNMTKKYLKMYNNIYQS